MARMNIVLGSFLMAGLLTSCSATHPENANQAASANSTSQKPQIASTSVVKVTAQPVVVEKGTPSEAVVKLTIDPGYHINANPPTFPYLKATELELAGDQGLAANFIRYPDAKTKRFAFAEQPLAVYEGEVLLKINLKTTETFKPGEQKLGARLRVQACDEEVCYAPGVIDFAIPVSVK